MLTTFFFFQKNSVKSFFAPTLLAAGLFLSTASGCFAQEVFNLSPSDSTSSGDSSNSTSSGDSSNSTSSGDGTNSTSSGDSANSTSSGDSTNSTSSGDSANSTSSGDGTDSASSGDDADSTSSANSTDTTLNLPLGYISITYSPIFGARPVEIIIPDHDDIMENPVGDSWASSGSAEAWATDAGLIRTGWAEADPIDLTKIDTKPMTYYESDTSVATGVTIPESIPSEDIEPHVKTVSGSQTADDFYTNAGLKVEDQHARAEVYKAMTNTDPYATDVTTAVVGSYINTRNVLNEMSEKIRDACGLDRFTVTINRASFYKYPNAYNNFEAKTKNTLVDAFYSLCNDIKYQKKKFKLRKRIKQNIYEVMFYNDPDREGVAMSHQDGTVQIYANFSNSEEISKSIFKSVIMSVIPRVETKRSQIDSVVNYQNQFNQDSDLEVVIGDSDSVGDPAFLDDK